MLIMGKDWFRELWDKTLEDVLEPLNGEKKEDFESNSNGESEDVKEEGRTIGSDR